MAINLKASEMHELRPRITVLGVGGAGGNAVNNMIESRLEGVDFVVANTDAQSLAQSKAQRRIQLGATTTEGLGAGARPDVGKAGAEESLPEIMEQLAGSHMVFITAGMGGGTGTGAAPVIARAVREAGILTVGVVTKPFAFEGDKRMRAAERGIEELQQYVHTLIVIPNQNLFRVANDRTTFAQAFAMADEVLHAGVRGVTGQRAELARAKRRKSGRGHLRECGAAAILKTLVARARWSHPFPSRTRLVKRLSADDTALATGWENRPPPVKTKNRPNRRFFRLRASCRVTGQPSRTLIKVRAVRIRMAAARPRWRPRVASSKDRPLLHCNPRSQFTPWPYHLYHRFTAHQSEPNFVSRYRPARNPRDPRSRNGHGGAPRA